MNFCQHIYKANDLFVEVELRFLEGQRGIGIVFMLGNTKDQRSILHSHFHWNAINFPVQIIIKNIKKALDFFLSIMISDREETREEQQRQDIVD